MSFSWTSTWPVEDEPGPRHDLRCPVWLDPGPVEDPEQDCTCRHRRPRLTTAERLDLILPVPVQCIEDGA